MFYAKEDCGLLALVHGSVVQFDCLFGRELFDGNIFGLEGGGFFVRKLK
jgi:hypothetical protein